MVIFTVFVKFCVPETRHKTFDEIARAFSRGWYVRAEHGEKDEKERECYKATEQNGTIKDTEVSLLNSNKEELHV